MTILEVLQMLAGSVFILFVPGFAWSYVFFGRKRIDWIERIALSFGLSIALVPLAIFWLNWLFHMRITPISTSLTTCGLLAIAGVYILFKRTLLSRRLASKLKRRSTPKSQEQHEI